MIGYADSQGWPVVIPVNAVLAGLGASLRSASWPASTPPYVLVVTAVAD